ncbi:Retrovirus-related Pol polyprotein from transposon 412 [Merluccius polli]|uniref:Retrovirus-related Pol polyprotein from transposon 412 n=1 Tax=Merluccius polli TaxID=89951 RepID=A0AA47MMD8_MERPO|nr:Retrovirus-related Pol polyprotein from transposon 412 [Merluccius polli]
MGTDDTMEKTDRPFVLNSNSRLLELGIVNAGTARAAPADPSGPMAVPDGALVQIALIQTGLLPRRATTPRGGTPDADHLASIVLAFGRSKDGLLSPLSREPDRRLFLNRGPGDICERALGLELNPRLEDGIVGLRFLLHVSLRRINFVGADNRPGDRHTPKRPPRVLSVLETLLGPGEPPPGTEHDSTVPVTAPVDPHVSAACDVPPRVLNEELLDHYTKDQLLNIAEYYEVDVGDKRQKEKVKTMLKLSLFEKKVLTDGVATVSPGLMSPIVRETGFTFDQQKELLMLKLENDRFKIKAELEKEVTVERLRQETEQLKLEIEQSKIALIREGKIPAVSETGKAQEAYASLSDSDSQKYYIVKSAVLRAYELVPEAYRQRFRTWKKGEMRSHLEFARELTTFFTRWYCASDVEDFEGFDLVAEQQADPSLKVLFEQVRPESEVLDSACGYFLQDALLVLKQLRVQHNQASAYHAQSQGALERFHQTLKSLLRAYCTELNKDWEEGLPWLMLAAREVTQESTGFSPNELVFAHTVRGPLAALCGNWKESNPPKNLIDYINGFRHRLYTAGELAKEKLVLAQNKMKNLYDRHAEHRIFSPGDQDSSQDPVLMEGGVTAP